MSNKKPELQVLNIHDNKMWQTEKSYSFCSIRHKIQIQTRGMN